MATMLEGSQSQRLSPDEPQLEVLHVGDVVELFIHLRMFKVGKE